MQPIDEYNYFLNSDTEGSPVSDSKLMSMSLVWLKRVLFILIGLIILTCIGYGISKLMIDGELHKKQVTTIRLLPDTPPPPPPPPPHKEFPKEHLKVQPKEVKIEQPKPAETPPAEQLKMEGAVGDGSGPFVAGAVNNEYKEGGVKTIGSDGSAKLNWYANRVKSQIEKALAKDERLSIAQYKLIINLWLKPNGDVEKLELLDVDVNNEIRDVIQSALENMPSVQDAPPQDMPRPIKLRITARKIS